MQYIIEASTSEHVPSTCTPSENSDTPAHSRCLTRIFPGCSRTAKNARFLYGGNGYSDQTTCKQAEWSLFITKTCLHSFDHLKPHFYIVKLGFIGVYIFLFLLKNIDCGYSLEPPRRVPTIYVSSRNMKNISFYLKIFSFWK